MKVACIGNLNQAQYILARYLRDEGHDVTLFLLEEQPNFIPENDTYGPVTGISVRTLPWKHKEISRLSRTEIRQQLAGFDYYSGSEFAPAYLYKAGIKMDLYIPLGTDLVVYPFQKPGKWIPAEWQIDEYQFNLYQKAAISHAGALFMNRGADGFLENALKKIGFRGNRYDQSLPYLYLPEYESADAAGVFDVQIAALREAKDLLVLNHSRCEFLHPGSIHDKGTDLLIRGLDIFRKRHNNSIRLCMVEYGNDLKAAKQLISELGLDEYVVWLPLAGRRDFFPVFRHFDAAVGNLRQQNWSYNVAMEAIAGGVPLIQRGPDEGQGDLYPWLRAADAEEVAEVFELLLQHPEQARNTALDAQKWFKDRGVSRPLGLLKAEMQRQQGKSRSYRGLSLTDVHWLLLDRIIRPLSRLKTWIQLRWAPERGEG